MKPLVDCPRAWKPKAGLTAQTHRAKTFIRKVVVCQRTTQRALPLPGVGAKRVICFCWCYITFASSADSRSCLSTNDKEHVTAWWRKTDGMILLLLYYIIFASSWVFFFYYCCLADSFQNVEYSFQLHLRNHWQIIVHMVRFLYMCSTGTFLLDVEEK
jgi:hypothetical protein